MEKFEKILKAVDEINNGTFFRIKYNKKIGLAKKKCKSNGIDPDSLLIKKVVETTVRTGVKYSNIKKVIEELKNRDSSEQRNYTNNYISIKENKVKFNSNTGKYYLCVAPISKGANTKVFYRVFDLNKMDVFTFTKDEFENSEYSSLLLDSETKKKSECNYYQISFDNIAKINKRTV